MIKNFIPVSDKVLFKKNDSSDPRLGELVVKLESIKDLKKNDYVIVGYPDDEGVKNSKGRVGAHLGPDSIREVFYKMTPSLNSKKVITISDAGNLNINSLNQIVERHVCAEEVVLQLLKKQVRVVTLGGGHDYGFPDFSAFCKYAASIKKKPFIVNFDAHLDVRPDAQGITSGTPFFRLLSKNKNVDFHEVGIQDWCNSKDHLKWLKNHGGKVVTLDEINTSKENLKSFLYKKVFKHFNKSKNILAISIDIDGFSSIFAPGASQVFPVGLDGNEFLNLWTNVVSDFNPLQVGVYEVNPILDHDLRTAKLSAIILHRFIFGKDQ